jgi:hypothetical protein
VTQQELADICGLKKSRVADVEALRRSLSREIARKLWRGLALFELALKSTQTVPLSSLSGLPRKEEVEAELAAIEAATNAVTA